MRLTTITSRLPLIALAGTACLLAACGMDPPPEPAQPAVSDAPAEVQTPAGLALVESNDFNMPVENAKGVRCNIETLGTQSLDGVRPSLAADRVVPLLGWYAMPAAPVAIAPDAAADNATTGGMAGSAPVAASAAKPMLVIASEGGSRQWTVPLPGLRLRRDVAEAFKDPALGKSGFDVELDLSSLRAGSYSLYLSDDAHRAESVCGLGRGFVIK